jgi:probable addiction module antidote protein
MTKPYTNYEDGLKKALTDPIEASEYLNESLESGSQDIFLMALRDVANARGFTQIARDTSLNRENLYRILSEKGNPQLSSLKNILDSLGLRLTIKPQLAVA